MLALNCRFFIYTCSKLPSLQSIPALNCRLYHLYLLYIAESTIHAYTCGSNLPSIRCQEGESILCELWGMHSHLYYHYKWWIDSFLEWIWFYASFWSPNPSSHDHTLVTMMISVNNVMFGGLGCTSWGAGTWRSHRLPSPVQGGISQKLGYEINLEYEMAGGVYRRPSVEEISQRVARMTGFGRVWYTIHQVKL